MLRAVQQRNNQFEKLVIPWVKAIYAAWGDKEAVSVRVSMKELHDSTFERTKSSVKASVLSGAPR